MNYILIVLVAYVIYFMGIILYDAFIAKPISKINNGEEQPVFALEGQQDLVEEAKAEEENFAEFEVKNVTVDNVEGISTDEFVDDDDIAEQDIETFEINAKAKMEQEAYAEFDDESDDDKFKNISVSDFQENQENPLNHAFLNKFQKSLTSKDSKEIDVIQINNEEEILEILQNPDNVTSFEYSSMKMVG